MPTGQPGSRGAGETNRQERQERQDAAADFVNSLNSEECKESRPGELGLNQESMKAGKTLLLSFPAFMLSSFLSLLVLARPALDRPW
jgi:hypothetical protein